MRLSVVVPFYRAVDFIPAAMQNLARQAQPGVEFVLVEDGSGDDTRDELHRWADKVPGARVVDLDVNRGLGGARNAGIDAAQGRYLTFLDADDWYGPGYLSDLVDAIELFGCEFVRVDHVQVRDRTRRVIRSPEGRRNEVFAPRESILPSERSSGIDYPYAWAGIFDLQQIPRGRLHFDPLHTCEDRPWLWRLYLDAASHAVVGLHGLFYRREVAGSLTQIGDERQLHFLDAFAVILDDLDRRPNLDPRIHHKAVRSFCAIIAHHLSLDARFTPEVRDLLHRRASAALYDIDSDELAEVFGAMGDRRVDALQSLMRRTGTR
ncbi:MAG: glycosyltransferase family 2 protein [Acidimicrobiia bacterium]|nr:glycosyltransferase family 2 protein [Acidimicrobiia bacterium]